MIVRPYIPIIDLFCGAGGMTLGFTRYSHGLFVPIWANDNNSYAVNTYNANFGDHCVLGSILDLLDSVDIPQADVVIGGPPCQGFSLLNKNRDGDTRKQLWRPYLEVVKRSGARAFVMENVPQLLGSPEYYEIETAAKELGFKVASAKLCAADYGVPQVRYRAFIIGVKDRDPRSEFPPRPTHHNPASRRRVKNGHSNGAFEFASEFGYGCPWRTVRDAIGDLPDPVGTQIRNEAPPLNLHWGRTPTETSLKRYEAISDEGMNRFDLQRLAPELTPQCWIRKTKGGTDLMGRLWWDRPSFTIRTEFYKPEKGRYLHPEKHRPITHREAARFQSFPDDFIFTGTKIEIAKQIGNAVPPLLAGAVANVVYELLTGRNDHNDRQIFATEAQPDNVASTQP